MLKVIIADDERIIRDTISQLIGWESLGLALIGQCENGIEAYDMIVDESPDIVMTDIRMPGLSGVDLIEKVAGTRAETLFILLSGFGEFEYAQKAMKYGVKHYLLKPCGREQIIESLLSAIAECNKRRIMAQFAEQQTMVWDALQAAIKQLCIRLCELQKQQKDNYRELQQKCLYELLRCLNGVSDPDLLLQLCSSVYFRLSDESVFCTPLDTVEMMQRLRNIGGIDEMRQIIIPELEALILNAPLGQRDRNTMVAQIKLYVQEHLSDSDLTLKWIAENQLYMNVDYVSRRFVRETGEKFSAYLNHERIRRAKELLADQGDPEKIKSIAEQVGCGNNPQYFSQLFKKHTGMTPSAYSKILRGTR